MVLNHLLKLAYRQFVLFFQALEVPTARYAHLDDAHLSKAVNDFWQIIEKMMV